MLTNKEVWLQELLEIFDLLSNFESFLSASERINAALLKRSALTTCLGSLLVVCGGK